MTFPIPKLYEDEKVLRVFSPFSLEVTPECRLSLPSFLKQPLPKTM